MLKISYCLCFTNFLVSKPIFNENNTVPIFKRMSIFSSLVFNVSDIAHSMQKCPHALPRALPSYHHNELYNTGLSSSLLVYAQPFKAPTHHTNHKNIHKSYFKYFQMSFFFTNLPQNQLHLFT